MSFIEPLFFVFIIPVLAGMALARGRARIVLLTLASYVFYAASFPPYVLILVAGTLIDFWLGNRIAAEDRPGRRRLWLVLTLTANLGVLAGFKYLGFFAELLNDVAALCGLGITVSAPEVRLPLGISFFTFQSLSYTLDIYRRVIGPAKSILDYASFIAFFPHLVAGPIIRARDYLPQLDAMQPLQHENSVRGMGLILVGYLKKCVVADNLGGFVDPVFADPAAHGGGAFCLAILFFAGQIYADFSGYTDVATGLSLMLGVKLRPNFHWPYLAPSLRDFWRRWHMSLSFFLRDYLYHSLGGDRHGTAHTVRNLVIVWFLGGLWHGAAWHFVVWGLWHGALVALGRVIDTTGLGRIWQRFPVWVRVSWTFVLVCLGWVFFRATSLDSAFDILVAMLTPWRSGWSKGVEPFLWLPMALFGCAALAHVIAFRRYRDDPTGTVLLERSMPVRVVMIALAAAFIVVFAGESRRFIYFDF